MTISRKLKRENTRELITENAIGLFAKKGYEQTSFQEIADISGLSQTTTLYHFKSKEGLFLAVIDFVQKNKTRLLTQNIDINDDAFIRLLKYLRGHINWAQVYRSQASVFLLLPHFASVNTLFADVYQEILSRERHEVQALIAAGQREKIFLIEDSTEILAEILQDVILGMITNLLAGRGRNNAPRQLEKKSKRILQKILNYETTK